MPKRKNNPLNTMNNHSNKTAQKENEISPKNKLKDMGICDLNEKNQDYSSEKTKKDAIKFI